jgi:DNA repair exonuclease SbcCD ATPase subunit
MDQQPQGNYLENLDNGLARLQQMVNDSNKSENFNQNIIGKIKGIDEKLLVLKQQANQIVNLVKQLKTSITNESLEFASNKEQIERLNQQILALNQEKETLNAEIARLTSGQSDAASELNAQIQRQEAKIQELIQKMEQRESEFLNQQKMQGEEFNAKDAKKLEQIQKMGQQIEELKQSATEKEAQLSQLTKEMGDAIREKQSVIDILRESSGGVNDELSKLRDENKMLIKKIIDSTNIIVNALNALEEIRKISATSAVDLDGLRVKI